MYGGCVSRLGMNKVAHALSPFLGANRTQGPVSISGHRTDPTWAIQDPEIESC
jgi:hypothetical protein